MAYFDEDGKRVIGRLATAGKGVPSTEIEHAVAEAVGRCKNKRYAGKGRAMTELKQLFSQYPQLKKNGWGLWEHPVSPLIAQLVEETFR